MRLFYRNTYIWKYGKKVFQRYPLMKRISIIPKSMQPLERCVRKGIISDVMENGVYRVAPIFQLLF